MKKQIEEEINKIKESYKQQPKFMISAYNREQRTIKDYNGRQLLELLQNADDEKSDEIYIELDTKYKTLIVSNKGSFCTPFSFEGITSLMISDYSSKVKRKNFIGNKGLGFRSIINWSKKITINSNHLNIVFSKKIADNLYDELITQKQHNEFIKSRNLSNDVKQVPFLVIPQIIEQKEDEWTTKIKIEYRDDDSSSHIENDIQKQINKLKDEILLFLNSLKRIIINIEGVERIIQKEKKNNSIFINNEEWKIYNDEDLLPEKYWDKDRNEEEYYELKIALKKNYNIKNNLLYSYFPTQINMSFPFIIHGTFDLDGSRNNLNISDKNKYILKKLVILITETAKKLTKNEVSYKALELLIYKDKHPILNELDFYENLESSIENLEIFPCIDNSYRKREDVIYIKNEFSNFLQKVNAVDLFPNLLLSTENSIIDISNYTLKSSISTEKLNTLSKRIKNIDDRVELIHLFYHTFKRENQLLFLIDEKSEFISIEDKVYTPPNSNSNLVIPKYVDIKFIHNELYKKLLRKFNIKPIKLVENLKEMTNIESYHPKSILNKIITTTNSELKKENIDKVKIIKEMVSSLYSNYNALNEYVPIEAMVQLVGKDGSIVKAKDLYLSETYLSGELTEELFKDIFEQEQFLNDIDFWEFREYEDKNNIESFFLWLGVNQYTKFGREEYSLWKYKQFLFDIEPEPNNCDLLYDCPKKSIDNIDMILKKLPKEKLILWILKDTNIQKELNKSYRILYDKNRGYIKRTYMGNAPSFVLFQLSIIFKDYFLTTNKGISEIINDNPINFNHYLFKKYNLERRDIESLILKLGAIENFNDLSKDKVIKILKQLSIQSPQGKYTQRIYQLAYKNYYEDYFYIYLRDTKLFATKNSISKYFNQNEIYYSGNTKIPKQISNSKAILNFPRGDSAKQVASFFGINDLSSIELILINKVTIPQLTEEFNNLFKTLIPYILTYRIKNIEKDDMAYLELHKLKKISIELCHQVVYTFESQEFKLEHSDYLKDNETYLIHIDTNYSLDELKQEFDFIDTFADIIGALFRLEDTKIFREIIKNSTDYIEKTIINDLGIEALYRAKELMGIANEKESFWKTIYVLLDKEYNYQTDNLLESIQNDLNLKIDITKIDYQDLKSIKSCKSIEELFTELDLTINEYNNQNSYYKLDFFKYHSDNLLNYFHNNQKNFQQYLYQWCIKYSKEKDFLSQMDRYTHNDKIIGNNLLRVNYQEIVEEFVKDNFQFDISQKIDNPIDYDAIYEKNQLEIEFEKIEGKREYLSLLYFDKLDEIKKYIEKIKEEEKPSTPPSKPSSTPIKPIVENPNLGKPSSPSRRRGQGGRGGTYNPNNEKPKRDKGREAEKAVYISLQKEYGKDNVIWVAKDDDNLHYDIKYKNSNKQWRYVEVKVYSNSKFYLSKYEKRFADNHKENYEIFLVDDNKIYKLTNIDFYDRNKFILEADDYIVYYGKKY